MREEIAEGVRESNLPAAIKDQYADQHYDPSRPYDQSVRDVLSDRSFMHMIQTMKAGARALRNSDYADLKIKRELLTAILGCWEQASRVLLVVLPLLAKDGYATYDGTGFVLIGNFGEAFEERVFRILTAIPFNVESMCEDDLFSKKMGGLLNEQLHSKEIGTISRHELALLLIHRRPREWHRHIQQYIASIAHNSFYLLDVYRVLRSEYQYSFASSHVLGEMKHLIQMAATKHVTRDKEPGTKTIARTMKSIKSSEPIVPPRDHLDPKQ